MNAVQWIITIAVWAIGALIVNHMAPMSKYSDLRKRYENEMSEPGDTELDQALNADAVRSLIAIMRGIMVIGSWLSIAFVCIMIVWDMAKVAKKDGQ